MWEKSRIFETSLKGFCSPMTVQQCLDVPILLKGRFFQATSKAYQTIKYTSNYLTVVLQIHRLMGPSVF